MSCGRFLTFQKELLLLVCSSAAAAAELVALFALLLLISGCEVAGLARSAGEAEEAPRRLGGPVAGSLTPGVRVGRDRMG